MALSSPCTRLSSWCVAELRMPCQRCAATRPATATPNTRVPRARFSRRPAARLVGGGGPEEAERPLDLLDDELRHRGEDRLGRAGIDALGGPARLQRLRVGRREPELSYERVAVLGAAHRYVAGEGGAALF